MELIIEGLKKKYDEKEVLKGINFTFKKGKIYGLLGRNGSGKTTLFNCLNEDINIDAGKFFIRDEEEIRETILLTKDVTESIIEIILTLDDRVNAFKNDKEIYEFTDISKLAI
ncbi:MAG: ATP-binding cassette domain-containing protein, partial [Christensenellaceae bacterium]